MHFRLARRAKGRKWAWQTALRLMRKFHPKKFSAPRAFHAVCVDALFACLFVAAAAQLSTFAFISLFSDYFSATLACF